MSGRCNPDLLTDWFQVWHKPIGQWLGRRCALSAADVDDLAQEVFLRILRYGNDRIIVSPQDYLQRVAANVVNEWRERAPRRRPHDASWLSGLQIEQDEEPESTAAREVLRVHVQQAIRDLPPRERQVIVMHIDEGMSCSQIARQLQLTERMVRRDIARAYRRLRLRLSVEDCAVA